MKRTVGQTFFAILLAVMVSAGLSLSAMQSNAMAVKMAVSLDLDGDGIGDCDSCPDDVSDGACIVVCTAAALALLPEHSGVKISPLPDLIPFAQFAPRDGPDSIEPYPPKRRIFV